MGGNNACVLNSAGAVRVTIPAGTLLYRVHSIAKSPETMLRASFRIETALVEELLPGLRFGNDGRRHVPEPVLRGKVLTTLRVTRDLTVLQVRTPPTKPGQWDGFVWQSELDTPHRTLALHVPGAVVEAAGPRIELDDAADHRVISEMLEPYRVEVPRPDDAPLVFVNYRSGDDTEVVDKLDTELRARLGDAAVFRDRRSMTPGQRFPELLRDMASRSKVLLVVVGPRWERARTDPDWTGAEIALAFQHRRHVVPLLVGQRLRLNPADLAEDIKRLADLQYLSLRENYTLNDVATVVDELIVRVPLLKR
ncbi:toll/interleukin-1 receptor domain-containing protein [Kibdelosporangium aridum]|uniref:Toll/interleukin-1 receptor domain-containing protein n=1 Tax=Kibdelosporangium aridum TaxID=2030 RepID=A0A428Z9M9_KIBAR|nr:toll/interleukin-1 receptor domain-containing protein [Kibdelosporangium aridum]